MFFFYQNFASKSVFDQIFFAESIESFTTLSSSVQSQLCVFFFDLYYFFCSVPRSPKTESKTRRTKEKKIRDLIVTPFPKPTLNANLWSIGKKLCWHRREATNWQPTSLTRVINIQHMCAQTEFQTVRCNLPLLVLVMLRQSDDRTRRKIGFETLADEFKGQTWRVDTGLNFFFCPFSFWFRHYLD